MNVIIFIKISENNFFAQSESKSQAKLGSETSDKRKRKREAWEARARTMGGEEDQKRSMGRRNPPVVCTAVLLFMPR